MTTGQHPNTRPAAAPEGEEPLPSFAEQMADQLGGWRGLVESSIPVVVFVLANIIGRAAAGRDRLGGAWRC